MEKTSMVLIQTAFLGDLLLSIPLMKHMRALSPDQEIILVCRKGFGKFFCDLGLVDKCFEIIKGDSVSYKEASRDLSKLKIGLLVSPHSSLRTALFCQSIRATQKIGFRKKWNRLFFDTRIDYPSFLPDALRQLSLLSKLDSKLAFFLRDYLQTETPYLTDALGKLPGVPSWGSMKIDYNEKTFADKYFDLLRKYSLREDQLVKSIMLFPGSVWATKRWTEKGYIETGLALQAQGFKILVMGGPGEEMLCRNVADKIPDSLDLSGKTSLLESFLLMGKAKLMIGNDSASVHLASAAELPIVAIFGPTVLSFGFRPWSPSAYIVEQKGLNCRPCGKHGHRRCPIKTHECMNHISFKDVLEKVQVILSKSNPKEYS